MFARTERLMLRPGWIEDAPALAAAIGDQAIARNLTAVPWPYGLEDAHRFLADAASTPLPHLLMFARTHGAPRLVGGIGLCAENDGTTELGYWVGKRYWGLGFATEAGRAMLALAHGSLKLARINAAHALDNPASGHVLRKLGFRATGQIVQRRSAGRAAEIPFAVYSREMGDVLADDEREPLAA